MPVLREEAALNNILRMRSDESNRTTSNLSEREPDKQLSCQMRKTSQLKLPVVFPEMIAEESDQLIPTMKVKNYVSGQRPSSELATTANNL